MNINSNRGQASASMNQVPVKLPLSNISQNKTPHSFIVSKQPLPSSRPSSRSIQESSNGPNTIDYLSRKNSLHSNTQQVHQKQQQQQNPFLNSQTMSVPKATPMLNQNLLNGNQFRNSVNNASLVISDRYSNPAGSNIQHKSKSNEENLQPKSIQTPFSSSLNQTQYQQFLHQSQMEYPNPNHASLQNTRFIISSSVHQSPSSSPVILSNSQQFHSRAQSRDENVQNPPANYQQASEIQLDKLIIPSQKRSNQLFNKPSQYWQLKQELNQKQHHFSYYHPEQSDDTTNHKYPQINNSILQQNIQNVENSPSQTQHLIYSRNNSRNEFAFDLSNQLNQEQQIEAPIAPNKGNPNPPKTNLQAIKKATIKPVENDAVSCEKYKGSSFVQYFKMNNNQQKDSSAVKQNGQSSDSHSRRNSAILNTFEFIPADAKQMNFGKVSRNNFNFHYVIGKGGFGKVWKVDHKKTKTVFAMKEMSKSKVITKRSVNSVMSERQLLSQLKHPFMVNMNFAFQDKENLYLVMDLLNGGDLRFHIGKMRRFSENQTKFFIACMMMSLEYLHLNNIIHRDIKPENLVIDDQGYVRVTDLGIARVWKPENNQDTSGTPGYMAPEVMCRQNHTIAVDYFAVGVIGYEFMMGKRPYLGRSRKEIRDQILSKQVQIKKNEIPEGWSIEAADFINRMIQRKPINRLGNNGPDEVKSHPWFKNFPWQRLENKDLPSPYIPQSIEENNDYRQQISVDERDTNEDLNQQNAILLRRNSVQNLFAGYNFESSPVDPSRQSSQERVSGINSVSMNPKQQKQQDNGHTTLQQFLLNNQQNNQSANSQRNNSSTRKQQDD